MSPLSGAQATAAATICDLRRRPGTLLAATAVAALLFVLPDVCDRAVDESAALGLQVAVSTIILFTTVVAGFAGLRACARESDLGATAEWRASPVGPVAYVLGRFGGIVALCAALIVILTGFAVGGDASTLFGDAPDLRVAAFAAAGTLLCAAQFAAVGMLFGALTTPQLASVLLVATIVATRTLVPELATRGGALAALAGALPDPARLDVSRELAFHRPINAMSAVLACAASAANTAACLTAASWALARRET